MPQLQTTDVVLTHIKQALTQDVATSDGEVNDLTAIAEFRHLLSSDDRPVDHVEFGALNNESAVLQEFRLNGRSAKTSRSEGATLAAIDFGMSRDLYRLVFLRAPERILEIGTCIGISTLYIVSAASKARSAYRMLTLEGGSNRASIARENLRRFGFDTPNVTVLVGRHENTLPPAIDDLKGIDFAFVDGSHIGDEVIDQHERILGASTPEAIVVYDDINWSAGMVQAWDRITNSTHGVSHTINCGRFGVCVMLPSHNGKPTVLSRDSL